MQSKHVPREPHTNWDGISLCVLPYLNISDFLWLKVNDKQSHESKLYMTTSYNQVTAVICSHICILSHGTLVAEYNLAWFL